MPSKYITFQHRGQRVVAQVFYNFSVIEDALIVMPVSKDFSLKEPVPFTATGGRWVTRSPLLVSYPETVTSIQDVLQQEFDIFDFALPSADNR